MTAPLGVHLRVHGKSAYKTLSCWYLLPQCLEAGKDLWAAARLLINTQPEAPTHVFCNDTNDIRTWFSSVAIDKLTCPLHGFDNVIHNVGSFCIYKIRGENKYISGFHEEPVARSGAVGWGAVLQGRRFVGSIAVAGVGHNPFGRTVALGSNQPLYRNVYQEYFLGVKGAGA